MSSDQKLNVFVSYSHEDKAWLERVQVHLKPLARGGKLGLWDDTRIKAGQRWRDEIEAALAQADVAILLISADFYASDFIANNELPPLLETQSKRGLAILGVHISYSHFEDDEILSEYQTVNTPNQPIKSLSEADQDKVLRDLARRIRELVPLRPAAPENGRLDEVCVPPERSIAVGPESAGEAAESISKKLFRFSEPRIIVLLACLLVPVLGAALYTIAMQDFGREVEHSEDRIGPLAQILDDMKSESEAVRENACSQLTHLGPELVQGNELGLLTDVVTLTDPTTDEDKYKPIRIDATACLVNLADLRIVQLALDRIPAAGEDGKFNLIVLIKSYYNKLLPDDRKRVARELKAIEVGPKTRELIDSFAT
jgi:hypothetical protein